MSPFTRRNFLKGIGAAAGSSFFLSTARSYAQIVGANERFRIGVAGLNGRGKSHIGGWLGQPNVELAWLVDVDSTVLGKAIDSVTKKVQGKYTPKGATMCAGRSKTRQLDAISVATPNHWHTMMTIWAAQAGKHVYVEKPASHDIYEGRVADGDRQEDRRSSFSTARRAAATRASPGCTRRSRPGSSASWSSPTVTAASRATPSASSPTAIRRPT